MHSFPTQLQSSTLSHSFSLCVQLLTSTTSTAFTAAHCLNRLKLHRQPQQLTALCKAVPLLNTCRHYFPNITELLMYTTQVKNEYKTYTRMHSSRMHTACSLTVGGRGVSAQGMYHVTYPIMHLMIPVCCPNTN